MSAWHSTLLLLGHAIVASQINAAKVPISAPECAFQSQPGLEYVGAGVDLASFLPRVGAISDMKHFVASLSCTKNITWRNPYTNTTYAIWDQVESVRGDPSSAKDAAFFKFWDTFSFQEHFEEDVSSGGLFGLFSASEEFDESFNLAARLNASLYFDFGKVNAFVAMLQSQLEPSEGYLAAVEALPFDWFLPTKWPEVESFIAQWGTHYIWQVSLGGEFRYTSVCENAYLHAAGSAHADAQAALDFLFLLTADGGASGSASAAETAYQAACARSVSCIGGDQKSCNMNSSSAWTQYVGSVDTTPGPGLTGAKYLLSADLIGSLHIKKYVAKAVSIAHIAWVGLEKLLAMYEVARTELQRIAALPDPQCFAANVSHINDPLIGPEALAFTCGTKASPDFRASACAHFGSSGDPLVPVRNARAWAELLLNQTSGHHTEMTMAKAAQNTSRKIDGWIGRVEAWQASFKDLVQKAFSMPTLYTCTGTVDSVPGFCCSLCCESPASSCGNLDAGTSRQEQRNTTSLNSRNGDCHKGCSAKLKPCHEEVILPSALTGVPPSRVMFI